jgi:hypothetical protein
MEVSGRLVRAGGPHLHQAIAGWVPSPENSPEMPTIQSLYQHQVLVLNKRLTKNPDFISKYFSPRGRYPLVI